MKIQSVFDDAFRTYGRVVDSYDYSLLLERLEANTPKPADSVVYVPSVAELEDTPAYAQLRDNCYGGMPIEIGYCNGTNTKLNCFEYHRDSEIDIAADDAILLVARQQDIIDGKIDSSKTEAFLCPKGTGVELYATTLHYAPCHVEDGGFRCVVILPKDTNTDMESVTVIDPEDRLLFAKNKWLIGHAEGGLPENAWIGLKGENISI